MPTEFEERYREIVEIIEVFCKENLNEAYLKLSKDICKAICSIEGNSIKKGKANSWACGIVHALGMKNGLLGGKGKQAIKASELYESFGISSSTGLSKSKEVRSLIDLENQKWSIDNVDIKERALEEVAATIEKDETITFDISELKIEDENLLKAIAIADSAWNQKNFKQKIKLAKEALSLSDDCAEAYIILSYDNSISQERQKELAIKAVEAAKRVIGEENIPKYIGKFLDSEVTKPYFSAKYRLGNILWLIGKREEAIEEFKNLIELCPEDNIMIRGYLLSWLIFEGKDEETEELLKMFKNDFLTATKYSKALYLFKKGNIDEAERALKVASVKNPFVIDYIIKTKRMPKMLPELKKLGTEEDAIYYMKNGEAAWNKVPGAIEWVKEFKKNQPF
ncbi:Putative Tetratricopeptide repeat domain protein [Clostridium chauvoei JF4335]|nr:Putative Tetratricopeptide repeat domain protein [Clostridium chauvoei JF4335]